MLSLGAWLREHKHACRILLLLLRLEAGIALTEGNGKPCTCTRALAHLCMRKSRREATGSHAHAHVHSRSYACAKAYGKQREARVTVMGNGCAVGPWVREWIGFGFVGCVVVPVVVVVPPRAS